MAVAVIAFKDGDPKKVSTPPILPKLNFGLLTFPLSRCFTRLTAEERFVAKELMRGSRT